MKTGALIAATGRTDSGSPREPLLQIGCLSAVQRLYMTFHLAGISPIVVVAAKGEQQVLMKHLSHMQIVFLTTDENAEMLEAVKRGLDYLSTTACDQVLVTPAHVPLFSVQTVKALVETEAPLAIPVCEGHRGHPLLLAAELFPRILEYTGGDGLRGATRQCGANPTLVEVDDPGVYLSSSQRRECEKIAASHDLNQWRPVVKLRIARESVFFGPGSCQLLSLIQSTGSVRLAGEHMGISISKAWNILNTLEKQAGYRVITRRKGGQGGGSSSLTEQGKLLVEWYERLDARCNEAVNEIFRENPPPSSP